jgi:hypothetical protein
MRTLRANRTFNQKRSFVFHEMTAEADRCAMVPMIADNACFGYAGAFAALATLPVAQEHESNHDAEAAGPLIPSPTEGHAKGVRFKQL